MPVIDTTAEAFAHAVKQIQLFCDSVLVVKLGGSAMEDPSATDAGLRSVAILNQLGVPVVLIHGGGKPIDRAMAAAGLMPQKVAGRRYTDFDTLKIVVQILGEINRNLCNRLKEFRAKATAMIDVPHYPLLGDLLKLPQPNGESLDLGWVGQVTQVDCDDLRWRMVECREIPILPSLAKYPSSPNGWLNINADTAAAAIAGALRADKAIFLTDTPGVLHDRNEPASSIPKLTEQQCRELIHTKVIDGGMVPKVEACFEALQAGAKSALILDGRVPFSLLDVFLHERFMGTEIVRSPSTELSRITDSNHP
jgi:acetylglutamate kinase